MLSHRATFDFLTDTSVEEGVSFRLPVVTIVVVVTGEAGGVTRARGFGTGL